MKKILFVCTANICRSLMAAAMFNALPRMVPLLPGGARGTAALRASPWPRTPSRRWRRESTPSPTSARRVSEAMIEESSWCSP